MEEERDGVDDTEELLLDGDELRADEEAEDEELLLALEEDEDLDAPEELLACEYPQTGAASSADATTAESANVNMFFISKNI